MGTSPIYTWQFAVRTYELDAQRVVKLTTYLNYMEEAATQASASLGFDYAWYMSHRRLWVARKHTIRFYTPAVYPDELRARTWISDLRRVQSHREYRVTRLSDDAPIFSARTNWVFINAETSRPERVPEDIARFFHENGTADGATQLEDLDTTLRHPISVENPFVFSESRRVEQHEIDPAEHVNNAVYVTWAEEAIRNLMRAAGWTEERVAELNVSMHPHAHEIEYFRSAQYDEPIQVSTRLAAIGQDRAAWQTEIRHASTGELLAQDVAVRRFSDPHGPRSIPDHLLMALRREPHP
jgi:acyl-CoA thioester hydrolase